MRVTLRDGQWADLRERITHAVDKDIRRSRAKGLTDLTEAFDYATVLVRAFVRDWNVSDPDGKAINLDDPDAIDRAPDDIVDELAQHAADQWTGATIPGEQYARLIGRLILGQEVGEAEVERLPDPDTFKDALLLATTNLTWSPQDLDDTDALLLALIQKIRNAKRG